MSLSMAGPIFGNWQGYLLSSNLGWLGILSISGLTLSIATANKVTGTRQRLGGMPMAFPYSSSLALGSEHRSLRMVKAMEFSEGSLIRRHSIHQCCSLSPFTPFSTSCDKGKISSLDNAPRGVLPKGSKLA
ncbi:hypothetical protein V6N13_061204 [Hibiscus sabdariffa]